MAIDKFSFLGNADVNQVEALFEQYNQNPESVEQSWRSFFEGFEFARTKYDAPQNVAAVKALKETIGEVHQGVDYPMRRRAMRREFNVINLINGYRNRGHLFTKTNPVRERRKYSPTLDLENFNLEQSDLEIVFHAGSLIGLGDAKLKDIIAHLEATYCESIGAEYKYIRTPEIVEWLETKMERSRNSKQFSIEEKKRILEKLNEAVAFESFVHTKFPGQKRFSLEGCEAMIPGLDAIIECGAELGIKEFVIGMAHRGRLNILANILGKSYEEIFTEFEGLEYDEEEEFAGDVKYHLGYSGNVKTAKGQQIHISLSPNPSHLEAVDSVVQGIVRSKIDNTPGGNENMIAPILIHGDAAIAGQGVVYEVIQMSQLKGYRTGGTIHLVINNQIGFTTSYIDGRSSTYCTDVAKVTLSPVFHINADDVEALVYTIQLAMEFRQKFHRDVFIDILGYRKYGHNEGDEPRFTQPLLYKAISEHSNAREIYNQKLLQQGEVEANMVKELEKSFKASLQVSLDTAKLRKKSKISSGADGSWKGIRFANKNDFDSSPETGVDKKVLLEIADKITSLPSDKKFFNKTARLFAEHKAMLEKDALDWSMGELLAYGTLLTEGHPVRLSGQDVERGTFSHRHAVVRIEDSEESYTPLNHVADKQAPFYIYNSLLSEYAVLGFDYGYALASPNSLVLWEAQFGDFMNGAQIIIDQYMSSAEDKWNRMNGIILLLPHGYEGQGAEHSSARLERFLALAAENNMQIINCTTPANFFHALRRQLVRDFRKPLVVLTPKSLLRHPKCVSSIEDMVSGRFLEIIDDATDANQISKVVLCSGKIYYELLAQKEKAGATNIAMVRLEQLYPLPAKQLQQLKSKYKKAIEWVWVQEEPENMGAWGYLLRVVKDIPLKCISRHESASPATGSHDAHEREQLALIEKVFEN